LRNVVALLESRSMPAKLRVLGQVAEWLMAADCKSAAPWSYGGSNPPLSTRIKESPVANSDRVNREASAVDARA
jgi:hypothetical protein